MTAVEFLALLAAGIGGGLTGSIAGLASLISYPALLAVGLSPVSANVTNTVALTLNSVGSVSSSRTELTGQKHRARRLASAGVVGGIIGGALLLLTPAGAFEKVVPWLIGVASVAIVVRRRPAPPGFSHPEHPVALTVGVAVIGVYGGYFGAAAGVLMLALLLALTGETLARSNAMKNLVLGGANGVAALGFAFFGPVHWVVGAPLAAGFFVGGRLGPLVVRRTPAGPLRIIIGLTGVGLAVRLGWQAYS